jgi:hypothetical protein
VDTTGMHGIDLDLLVSFSTTVTVTPPLDGGKMVRYEGDLPGFPFV